MTDLRNVIVVSVGQRQFAFEIRWVREVATLGFVTLVPSAPPSLCGVCNWHGQILALVDIPGAHYGTPARQGSGALVIDLSSTILAVRLEKIERVASLEYRDGKLQDGTSGGIDLIDPEAMYLALRTEVERVGETQIGGGHSLSPAGLAPQLSPLLSTTSPEIERTREGSERIR
jgi:chemotaxis signal transduction protein